MIEKFGGTTSLVCFILLLVLLSFFSIRFIFFADKFVVERGYNVNTAIFGRLVGAFMSSYLISGLVILFRENGLEGALFYFVPLSISFVLIFVLMGLQFFKFPKDYGIEPNPQPVIASFIGSILIQIIIYYN